MMAWVLMHKARSSQPTFSLMTRETATYQQSSILHLSDHFPPINPITPINVFPYLSQFATLLSGDKILITQDHRPTSSTRPIWFSIGRLFNSITLLLATRYKVTQLPRNGIWRDHNLATASIYRKGGLRLRSLLTPHRRIICAPNPPEIGARHPPRADNTTLA